MQDLKFMISSSEAEKMAQSMGLKSTLNLLPYIAQSAQKLAHCPISNFPVAAVGLSSDGRIFIGVNVEFPGLPLHHSIHAEQFLITNISNYPHTQLKNVVVSAYPCGHCRQFLQEIRGAPDIQILVLNSDTNIDKNETFLPLSYYLPHRFGPDDLLHKDVPLILETQNNNIKYGDDNNNNHGSYLCNGFGETNETNLVKAAFDAANKSHAPYSCCPSGVALIDNKGNVFKGSYLESAAYNPSMGPAQAAVIAYMAAAEGGGGYDFEKIVGAVLVEGESGFVKQEETVRLFLKVVSPKCDFRVFHCKKTGSIVAGI